MPLVPYERFIAEGSYDDRLKIEWHSGEIPRRHNESGKRMDRANERAISASARGKSHNAVSRVPHSREACATIEHSSRTVASRLVLF